MSIFQIRHDLVQSVAARGRGTGSSASPRQCRTDAAECTVAYRRARQREIKTPISTGDILLWLSKSGGVLLR
jgi:hypothetical protein